MNPSQISEAVNDDAAWGAALMSSSDPWITLGLNRDACFQSLARPGAELFIARTTTNAERLGLILLAPYGFAGSPYIAAIAVSDAARGQGIGSQLLRFAESRFASRRHLFLLVSSFNHRARAFYLRHGYQQLGELKDYVTKGYSEILLSKELA